MNLPNKITVVRICLIPVMVAFFFIDAIPANDIIAAAVFVAAAFTDFLDGYIARKRNLVTDLGKFLDPIADKVLVITAMLLLLEGGGMLPAVYGVIGVAVIVAREFMVSAFRLIAATNGKVIAADKLGKFKTVAQDVCIPVLMCTVTWNYDWLRYTGWAIFALAVLLTVISGISYLVKNRDVLKGKEEQTQEK